MQNTNKTVIGSYDSRDEALDVVHKLKNDGYQKQDIILYGNESVANSIGDHEGVNITADTGTDTHDEQRHDDESLWDKIKHAFSTDTYDEDQNDQSADYDQDDDVLYPYRDDIKNGNIVVAVENFRDEDIEKYNTINTVDSDMPANDSVPAPDTMDRTDKTDFDDNETIQLKEEKLDVDKSDVSTGEVNVRKEVKTDTETVEVPVEKEEVVVERKPVSDLDPSTPGDPIDTEGETINIPVKEEQIEVTKRPVVKEEVEVRKERHQETKHVAEEVSKEELDVDTKGDVRIDDHDGLKDKPRLDTDNEKDTDKDIADELRSDPNDPKNPPPVDQDKDLGI